MYATHALAVALAAAHHPRVGEHRTCARPLARRGAHRERDEVLGPTGHAPPPRPLQAQRTLEQPVVRVDVRVDELAVVAVVKVKRRLACSVASYIIRRSSLQ